MLLFYTLLSLAFGSVHSQFLEYDSFDGPGFPLCHNVTEIHNATSVDDMVAYVKQAAADGVQVRPGGKGHSWYDTACADVPTRILRTEFVNDISNFQLAPGAESGNVVVEGGVTFFQLADYLHARGADMGTGLVNWNISIGGAVAMGAHRTSLGSDAVVVGGVQSIDIIDGSGTIRTIVKDETNEDWLAASTSLGLLGVIARLTMTVYPEIILSANQITLNEADVLNGDIYGMISSYPTANFWWWPYMRKFHYRYYERVTNVTARPNQKGFQSTFSLTAAEGAAAWTLLNSGKYLQTSNQLAESIFFGQWSAPNFHTKDTDQAITSWPVTGFHYDVLIGGLYPGLQPEWDYNLHALTLELAFPVTMANAVLQRIRALFDAQQTEYGITMTSTYRSGINIKFGRPHFDLLGQVTTGTADGADWSKGAMMFDFPAFKPGVGDGLRFNEPFYHNLSATLIQEFPCRPHWTKNSREVYALAAKRLDSDRIARFKAVRQKFDPNGMFRSVLGEIIGVY